MQLYVARIPYKFRRLHVGSYENSVLLEDPTRVRHHYGESKQHICKYRKEVIDA